MMFLDCYLYEVDGFPVSTYRVPNGIDMQALRRIAECYYRKAVFVEESNGCSPQDLPPDWLNEI